MNSTFVLQDKDVENNITRMILIELLQLDVISGIYYRLVWLKKTTFMKLSLLPLPENSTKLIL